MSYLVADFLINPVLRQARLFSGNSTPPIDSVRNQHTRRDSIPNSEASVTQTAEPVSSSAAVDEEGCISRGAIVSSPVQEDGGLVAQLAAFDRSRTTRGSPEPPDAIPLPLASFSPERMSIDENISSNPSVDVLGGFQRASATSPSFSSTTLNRRDNPRDISRSLTEDNSQSTPPGRTARQRNRSLPEDDGMGDLRKRIIKIQERDVPASEKARLMHNLLTEGYTQSQISLHAKNPPRPHSPASMVSQERPTTPGSLSSFSFWQTSTNDTPPQSSPSSSDHTFYLSQDDLKPTYTPVSIHPSTNSDSGDSDDTEPIKSLGCQHYKRNIKLQCFTCGGWYTCRFCHDEVEDHVLNRKETRNMLCMLCGCAQRASDTCSRCGVRAAWYYCGICKLWDDDAKKSIYHCADCGICRIGRGIGKDYFHCKTCGVCVSIASETSHKCIERATECDCPICGEYLFSSLQSVVFMRCGHSIHRKCHDDLMKTSYKCPICNKSIVNMETQFRNLDRAIESQPMPPQFQDTKAIVSCNDCSAKSLVKYHWLGLKCTICDSYNTVQIRILSDQNAEVATEMAEALGSQPMQMVGNNPVTNNRVQFASNIGSAVSRRHSSHIQPIPSETDPSSLRFSPYQIPQRMGRSVSPFRASALTNDSMVIGGLSGYAAESDDEDEVDFWGGDAPRSSSSGDAVVEEDDDSDDDSVVSMEEGDDGDDEDHMELLGHR